MSQEVTYRCLPLSIIQTSSGTAWTDPANVLAKDGSSARSALSASTNTQNLDLMGLQPVAPGWLSRVSEDPTQFSVSGISVRVFRKTDVSNTARDLTVQRLDGLSTGASAVGNNLANTSANWSTVYQEEPYGGAVGVWGSLPTISDVLNEKFGMRFTARNISGAFSCVPEVDDIRVDITITEPSLPAFREGGPPSLQDPSLIYAGDDFEALVRQPGSRGGNVTDLVWLVEFTGYNEDTAETETYTWCNGPSGGYLADTDGDGQWDTQYDAVLTQPFQMDYRLLGNPRIAGDINPSSGRIVASNLDGRFDALRRVTLDGKTITVKVGAKHLDYGSFVTAFTGVIDKCAVSRDAVELSIVDRRRLLNAALQPIRWSTAFSNVELRNAVQPIGFGVCRNITPKWETSTKARLMGDFPFQALTAVRVDGSTISSAIISGSTTVDYTNGTIDFDEMTFPAGQITFDIKGVEARNVLINSRDATTADWVKTGCTASLLAFGIDGTASRGFRLIASTTNATCNPTVHESPASPVQWGSAVHSYYMRMVSGSGLVTIGTSVTSIQLTTEWRRYFVIQNAPSFPIGGITIAASGDVIEVDFPQYEPGFWYPSPPIDTTNTGALVRNYPDTMAAIIKFILTARSGLVPYIDFDEDSFTLAASKVSAVMGRYWTDETTVLEAVGLFLESGGFGLMMDRDGKAKIGRVGMPETAPSRILTERDLFEGSALVEPEPTIGRVIVRCQKNHTPQTNFAAGVGADTREKYARDWVDSVALSSAVIAKVGDVAEATLIVETALDQVADASRKAIRDLELFSVKRSPATLNTSIGSVLTDPMDTIRVSAPTITHDRDDERDIADLFVRSVSTDAAAERVVVQGWGGGS